MGIILKSSILTFTLFNRVPFGTFNRVHAIVSDGLFRKSGTFYVMPDVDLKPLALDTNCQGLERLTYNQQTSTVIYRSKLVLNLIQ